jgi:hypothetical protein
VKSVAVRQWLEPARLPYWTGLPHWGLPGLHISAYSGPVFRNLRWPPSNEQVVLRQCLTVAKAHVESLSHG